MSKENRTVNFKLDRETFLKLSSAKNVKLDVKDNETAELILPDSRIRLDADKKKAHSATYYNNKSSSLYYLGDSVPAISTTKVLSDSDKKRIKTKEREKTTTRGVELLDIPSIPTTLSPSSPIPPTPPSSNSTSTTTVKPIKPLKKPTSNNITKPKRPKSTTTNSSSSSTTTNNNIPNSRGSMPSQSNTPRPSSVINPPSSSSTITTTTATATTTTTNAPVEKLNDRIIQLLALKPYPLTTMAKLVESTQWEVKKIMDEVGIQLPDPQKKKYCLKPTVYKNIRIWDWPLYTNEEKMIACDNAKEAYDLLNLPVDAPERQNLIDPTKLIQPPPGRVQLTTERDRAIAAKKNSNKTLKKQSPNVKGKGKTTPSGFSYSSAPPPPPPTTTATTTATTTTTTTNATQEEPFAPTPSSPSSTSSISSSSSKITSPAATRTKPSAAPWSTPSSSSKITSPVSTKTKSNTSIWPPPSSSTTTTTSSKITSPVATRTKPAISPWSTATSTNPQQQHLKPSSSNRRVSSKGLPPSTPMSHSNFSSPIMERTSSTPSIKTSPILTKKSPVATKPSSSSSSSSSSKFILPPRLNKLPSSKPLKRSISEPEATGQQQSTSNKKIKSTTAAFTQPHAPIELSNLSTQPIFDNYCSKYIKEQKSYSDIKNQLKQKYPHYIKVLESTSPPTGSKRSYYDLKLEYYDLVKEKYLKTKDQSSWEQAESHLKNCNAKRRRLNYMWDSIKKNLIDNKFKLNCKI
ncbi:hypothetical protein BD770DRAFT_174909 [Pilaira anomala]|nr:hypothetical protein BD770DRAFT_174909 [Pilaira anomala]